MVIQQNRKKKQKQYQRPHSTHMRNNESKSLWNEKGQKFEQMELIRIFQYFIKWFWVLKNRADRMCRALWMECVTNLLASKTSSQFINQNKHMKFLVIPFTSKDWKIDLKSRAFQLEFFNFDLHWSQFSVCHQPPHAFVYLFSFPLLGSLDVSMWQICQNYATVFGLCMFYWIFEMFRWAFLVNDVLARDFSSKHIFEHRFSCCLFADGANDTENYGFDYFGHGISLNASLFLFHFVFFDEISHLP